MVYVFFVVGYLVYLIFSAVMGVGLLTQGDVVGVVLLLIYAVGLFFYWFLVGPGSIKGTVRSHKRRLGMD